MGTYAPRLGTALSRSLKASESVTKRNQIVGLARQGWAAPLAERSPAVPFYNGPYRWPGGRIGTTQTRVGDRGGGCTNTCTGPGTVGCAHECNFYGVPTQPRGNFLNEGPLDGRRPYPKLRSGYGDGSGGTAPAARSDADAIVNTIATSAHLSVPII